VKQSGERIGVQILPPFPEIMSVAGLPVLQFLQDVLPGPADQGKILLQKGHKGTMELWGGGIEALRFEGNPGSATISVMGPSPGSTPVQGLAFSLKKANDLLGQRSFPAKGITGGISHTYSLDQTGAGKALQSLAGSGPGHPNPVRHIHCSNGSVGLRRQEPKEPNLPFCGKNLCESEVRKTLI